MSVSEAPSISAIPGFEPLPQIAAAPEQWQTLRRRLEAKVFLRSEGMRVWLDAPRQASPELSAQAAEVVAAFSGFYDRVAAAFAEHPALRPEFGFNELLRPLLDLGLPAPSATPLARLDCVLDTEGRLRVIENNATGACLIHYRNLFYIVRGLHRGGFAGDAERLDSLVRELSDGFRRHYEASTGSSVPARPLIGALFPSGWLRAGKILYRAAFERHGWDCVVGGPEHLDLRADGVYLQGRRVDLLWSDFLFYMAYQALRYRETRFPTKIGAYGKAPEQVAAILADRRFLEHLASGRTALIGPPQAFLALSKSHLSWIHRRDLPVDLPRRELLQRHAARSYAAADRQAELSLEEACDRRAELVWKPVLYGGSHGVTLGASTDADAWRQLCEASWGDHGWVLQEYVAPNQSDRGETVSIGLASFGGRLGGFILRTAPSVVVNARDSAFVPAVSS